MVSQNENVKQVFSRERQINNKILNILILSLVFTDRLNA